MNKLKFLLTLITSEALLLSIGANAAGAIGFNVTGVTTGTFTDGTDATVNGITYQNQSLPVTALSANSQTWDVGSLLTNLTLRRSGVGTAAGRQVIWSERPASTPDTTVRINTPTTTEAALNQTNLFQGTDNLFVNTGNNAGNMSDVERADFILNGISVASNSTRGIVVMERGTSTAHDGFKIAAITGLDANGKPSSYGSLLQVNAGWGTTALRTTSQTPAINPSPNPTYTILNNSSGSFARTQVSVNQNVGGILIPLTDLAAANTTVYGYSLFAIDVNDAGNSSNLTDWTNATIFPTNTQEGVIQGGGGIDLSAFNVGFADSAYKANKPKLFEVEGRAGAFKGADYEFAIGSEGANSANTGQIYRDWNNGELVNWSLAWDSLLGKSTFNVGGTCPASGGISYTNSSGAGLNFNYFNLIAYSKQEAGKVDAGTSIAVTINNINGNALSNTYSASAVAGGIQYQNLDSGVIDPVTSMCGTVKMSWLDGALNPNLSSARSRVGFKIKGFDPPISPASAARVSTPEPGTLLGLLAIGFLGVASVRKSH